DLVEYGVLVPERVTHARDPTAGEALRSFLGEVVKILLPAAPPAQPPDDGGPEPGVEGHGLLWSAAQPPGPAQELGQLVGLVGPHPQRAQREGEPSLVGLKGVEVDGR